MNADVMVNYGILGKSFPTILTEEYEHNILS